MYAGELASVIFFSISPMLIILQKLEEFTVQLASYDMAMCRVDESSM
jgi:hypothetical protein